MTALLPAVALKGGVKCTVPGHRPEVVEGPHHRHVHSAQSIEEGRDVQIVAVDVMKVHHIGLIFVHLLDEAPRGTSRPHAVSIAQARDDAVVHVVYRTADLYHIRIAGHTILPGHAAPVGYDAAPASSHRYLAYLRGNAACRIPPYCGIYLKKLFQCGVNLLQIYELLP